MSKKLNYTLSEDGCYVTLEDGSVFEKVRDGLVSVELELDNDVLETLDKAVNEGHFVSRQEMIRTALRETIKGHLEGDSVLVADLGDKNEKEG